MTRGRSWSRCSGRRHERQEGQRAIVGVGVAACAVCCAGPILAVLAAIGLGTAAGFAMFGAIALAIGASVAVVAIVRRRRRAATCPTPDTAVARPVELSGTRSRSCSPSSTGEHSDEAEAAGAAETDEERVLGVNVDDRIVGMWGLEDTWTWMRQLTGVDITLGDLGTLRTSTHTSKSLLSRAFIVIDRTGETHTVLRASDEDTLDDALTAATAT